MQSPLPSALGACNGTAAAFATGDGTKDDRHLPGLVAPPTAPPKSIAQFSWMSLPSKTDVPGSTPQAISTAGRPAVKIAGPTAPWPSSAPLWPAAIAVVIVPIAGVRGRCHYPGNRGSNVEFVTFSNELEHHMTS